MANPSDTQSESFQESLEGYKFQTEGGRAIHFFLDHLLIKTYTVEDNEWPLGDVNVFSDCIGNNTQWVRIHKDQSAYENALGKFLEQPYLCHRLQNDLKRHSDALIKKLRDTDFNGLSDDELKDLIDSVFNDYQKVIRPAPIIRLVDLALIPRLLKVFQGRKDRDELVAIASVSEEPSFNLSEEMALLSLAAKIGKEKLETDSREVSAELSRIKDTYRFSEMGYFNERVKTIEDYKERLSGMIRGSPEERLAEIKADRKMLLDQKRELTTQASAEDQKIIRIASTLAHIKDLYKTSINQVIFWTEPLLHETAERTGEPIERIKDLSPEEMKRLIDRRPLDWKTIEDRTDSHILISFNKRLHTLTGQEADRFRRRYQEASHPDKEFTGRCASRGHVTGKARIVLGRNDFTKVEKDDILVVMNTSPDFTPILKMAKAIVAEEGGLTAHVSIISREMKVPAVVGISRITSILKDGDLVEVDANKGVVRIVGM